VAQGGGGGTEEGLRRGGNLKDLEVEGGEVGGTGLRQGPVQQGAPNTSRDSEGYEKRRRTGEGAVRPRPGGSEM